MAQAVDPAFVGGELRLRSYDSSLSVVGDGSIFEVAVLKGAKEACFGLIVPRETCAPPERHRFEVDQWAAATTDPMSSPIYVASMEEAWRIICLLAALLRPANITVGYGL